MIIIYHMQSDRTKPLILKTCFPRIEKKNVYAGRIYERKIPTGTTAFDVEISTGSTRGDTIDGRKMVHEIVVRSARDATVDTLTRYLNWKFQPFQRSGSCTVVPVRSRGHITHIRADLEWIKSIVEVEFDYHVGSADCMRAEHKEQMREYRKSQAAGYKN